MVEIADAGPRRLAVSDHSLFNERLCSLTIKFANGRSDLIEIYSRDLGAPLLLAPRGILYVDVHAINQTCTRTEIKFETEDERERRRIAQTAAAEAIADGIARGDIDP